jgi:hypothetical protein
MAAFEVAKLITVQYQNKPVLKQKKKYNRKKYSPNHNASTTCQSSTN